MLPQLNNFFASLLPQINAQAPQGPATQVQGGGANAGVMEMLKNLVAGGQQAPAGGGMPPDMWAKLLEPENVDVVGQANRTSNLAGGKGGNPWGSGFFKPMDQAFADDGNRPRTPNAPFAGAGVQGQVGAGNPFMNFGALVPAQQKPKQGFSFGTNYPRF